MANKKNSLQVVGFRDFVDPNLKAHNPEAGKEDWMLRAVQHNYSAGGAKSLLHGKDVKRIKQYASGKHPMEKFRAMYPKPTKNKGAAATDLDRRLAENMGIDFEPLAILQQPLSNAIATVQKSLVDISFDAIDPTANANRKLDMDRVRNRPLFENAVSPAKKILKMPLSPVEPENNVPTVDISTLELDPQKEDELNLWADVFYKLRPESAFEITTEALMYWTDFKEKQDLEKRDSIYYGVQSSRAYISDITNLPAYDYVFPGNVYSPPSELADFSDQPFRYIEKNYNIEQILNVMGKETIDEDFLIPHFERYWKSKSYTQTRWANASESQKMEGIPLVYMELKSWDVLRIEKFTSRSGRTLSDVVPFNYKTNAEYKLVQNKWPQQTYFAYWFPGSDTILKSGKVLGSMRAKGKESLSRFTIQIYKSKDLSDVEMSIPIVDNVQRAYIKLQHLIIMAKVPGQFIDTKYVRAAAEQLEDDLNFSVEAILNLFFVHNTMIGDTEGMDGDNEGQFLPFRKIEGGMAGQAREYLEIIHDGHQQLAKITGWNDAFTGQAPNPDGLVGLQKLLLQSAVNSLHYAQKASKHQTLQTVHAWAPMIQYICRAENKNSEARKALENIIGANKIDLINDMDSLSAHQFGLRAEDAPSTEDQEDFKRLLGELVRGQRIELSEYFLLRRKTFNLKDAQRLLIISEKKKAAEIRRQITEANAAIARSAQITAQGKLQGIQMSSQGEVQEEQVKGQFAMDLFSQKAQLELTLKQVDREIAEMNKRLMADQAERKLVTKHNLDEQKSLAQ